MANEFKYMQDHPGQLGYYQPNNPEDQAEDEVLDDGEELEDDTEEDADVDDDEEEE